MNAQLKNSIPKHIEKIAMVRNAARDLFKIINDTLPECRERSIAYMKLDETVLWVDAGISKYREK